MSLIWTSLAIALVLNLIVFLVAYEKQTDKLTDITYALTFIIIALYSWWAGEDDNGVYKITLLFMVLIWAVRLGSYLFVRVNIKGKDHRFDAFRNKFWSNTMIIIFRIKTSQDCNPCRHSHTSYAITNVSEGHVFLRDDKVYPISIWINSKSLANALVSQISG